MQQAGLATAHRHLATMHASLPPRLHRRMDKSQRMVYRLAIDPHCPVALAYRWQAGHYKTGILLSCEFSSDCELVIVGLRHFYKVILIVTLVVVSFDRFEHGATYLIIHLVDIVVK